MFCLFSSQGGREKGPRVEGDITLADDGKRLLALNRCVSSAHSGYRVGSGEGRAPERRGALHRRISRGCFLRCFFELVFDIAL